MKSVTRIILKRTDEIIWYRGQDYADNGRVDITKYDNKHVKALVSGSEDYEVSLKIIQNIIERKCSCPYNRGICKHMVATAIIWDELLGVKRPSQKEIKVNSITSKSNIRKQIDIYFNRPLKADLNIIRIMVEYYALPSKRKSTHAILPECPNITKDTKTPLKIKEVESTFKEMEKWTRIPSYDSYFCAGEMAAAFCELLDVISSRSSTSSAEEMINIMALCVEWYYKTFSRIMDGSDGVWIFPVARIGRNVDTLKRIYPYHSKWEEFNEIVQDAASEWETGIVDSDFIASWKESCL